MQVSAYPEVLLATCGRAIRFQLMLEHRQQAAVRLFSSSPLVSFRREQADRFVLGEGPVTLLVGEARGDWKGRAVVHCVEESQGNLVAGWLLRGVAEELLR